MQQAQGSRKPNCGVTRQMKFVVNKNPARSSGRAQLASFNFSNRLSCAPASRAALAPSAAELAEVRLRKPGSATHAAPCHPGGQECDIPPLDRRRPGT